MASTTTTDAIVGLVMRTPVVAVESETSLRKAARAMRDADIGTLAVMEGTAFVGVVSERDVTRAIADGADPDEIWVSDVMSAEPRYLTVADEIATAREVMVAAGIRHLPVIDEGELVGIVSMRDLLNIPGTLPVHVGELAELRTLVVDALGDLSTEIAGTDNPSYRGKLRQRRELLEHVLDVLVAANPHPVGTQR